jgi:hypothetical protein
MQGLASAERAKVLLLEQEVERLRPLEQELLRFKARLPAIEHYLRLLPRLVQYAYLLSCTSTYADTLKGERVDANAVGFFGLSYGFGANSKLR